MDRRNLQVAVDNFGPIRSGSVELKPLTLFIGPNNSGKSYLAQLIYALAQALASPSHLLSAWTYRGRISTFHDVLSAPQVPFRELQPSLQERLRNEIERLQADVPSAARRAIHDYFGYEDARELVLSGGDRRSLTIRMSDNRRNVPFLTLRNRGPNLTVECDLGLGDGTLVPQHSAPIVPPENEPWLISELLAGHLWATKLAAMGLPERTSHYMPAARSGILIGSGALSARAIGLIGRGPDFGTAEIAPFVGVTGDFLQGLALLGDLESVRHRRSSPDQASQKKLRSALALLEDNILGGHVSVHRSNGQPPSLRYESVAGSLPIHRVSSMVLELAPLDLWLKYLVNTGDLLILEEPEAHLHPENQLRIARVLVRLIRAGVHVLSPTHSSLILHQISNLMLAAEADPSTRKKLGLTDEDQISADDVGVYLFEPRDDGTRVTPVPIEPGFGISEDEFLRVYEAIGEETYRLETALLANGVTA